MSSDHPAPRPEQPFGIIDALGVVGPWRDRSPGQPYGFDDLLAEHSRYGIGRRLVLHAEARDGVPENGNAALTRLTVLRDDTASIWAVLPPRRFGGDTAERMLGDAQSARVAMFALFPETHGHHVAPWANRDLYRAMESARLPLVLDIGNVQGSVARARYEEVHAIATAYPKLPIILWNAFYVDERLQVPLLDLCPNVLIGIATVFIPTWGIEQYTARYGPARLIFGSNWPRQSPGPLITYVQYADVHRRTKEAILGGTVTELMERVKWPVSGFPRAPAGPGASSDQAGAAGSGPAAPDSDAAQSWDDPRSTFPANRAPGEEGR